MKLRILLSLVFVSLLFSAAAFAAEDLILNIPFKLTVGDKILDPGKYTIVYDTTLPDRILVRDTAGKEVANAPVITRLAKRENPTEKQSVVFDEVNGKKILSEIWLHGEDGFLLNAEKGKHTHAVLKGAK